MRNRCTIAAMLVAASACGIVAAQTGGITVEVKNADKEPLVGAIVRLSNEMRFMKAEVHVADADGVVEFPVLRPGRGYRLEVAHPGFATTVRTVRVAIGPSVVESVVMLPDFVETLKIETPRPTVGLDQVEAVTHLDEGFIRDLPVAGRNYQNVLVLAPGVQDSDGDGNPTVNGSRERDFKASVGGVSNVDPLTGFAFGRVNASSIEAIEVITSAAGVEHGRAQGGYANIIQKQGGNEHEGVFELYFRSSALDGAGSSTNRVTNPSFDWWQPGFQLSGPILRDRLWYRLSHEGRDIDRPVDTIDEVVVQRVREGTHSDQLTWQLSPRNKLALGFGLNASTGERLGVDSRTPVGSSFRQDAEQDSYTVTWDAPYSSRFLVQTVVGWQDERIERRPTNPQEENRCASGGLRFLEAAFCTDLVDRQNSGPSRTSFDRRTQRFTLRSHATLFGGRFLGMSHRFKFGVQIENERFFEQRDTGVAMARRVFRDLESDDPEEITRLDVLMTLPEEDRNSATSANWSLFVEDRIRPARNLSMTLGLRLYRTEVNAAGRGLFDNARPEAEFARYVAGLVARPELLSGSSLDNQLANLFTRSFSGYGDTTGFQQTVSSQICGVLPPEEVEGCLLGLAGSGTTQIDGFLGLSERRRRQSDIVIGETNLDWQLALAWSPFENGRTTIHGSVRRTHGIIPLNVPLLESLDEVAFAYQIEGVGQGNAPQILDPARPRVDVTQVRRDLRIPYTDEFELRFERQLWRETSMALTLLHKRGRDQLQDININLAPGDFGACGVVNSPDDAPLVAAENPVNIFGGDGVLDDCQGRQVPYRIPGASADDPFDETGQFLTRPDGIPDLYTLNPNFGNVFEVGNYNESEYDSVQLRLTRAQYRGWEYQASYVWSKAEGDGEDFVQTLGDDPTLREDEFGYLSHDQRHVIKFNATTVTPWGIRLGTAASWQSGLPFSLLRRETSRDAIAETILPGAGGSFSPFNRPRTVYVTGRRNDQRNPAWWNIDVRATKEMDLGRTLNLQLSAEIFNLMDDDTLRVAVRENGFNAAVRTFGRRWQIGAKLAF